MANVNGEPLRQASFVAVFENFVLASALEEIRGAVERAIDRAWCLEERGCFESRFAKSTIRKDFEQKLTGALDSFSDYDQSVRDKSQDAQDAECRRIEEWNAYERVIEEIAEAEQERINKRRSRAADYASASAEDDGEAPDTEREHGAEGPDFPDPPCATIRERGQLQARPEEYDFRTTISNLPRAARRTSGFWRRAEIKGLLADALTCGARLFEIYESRRRIDIQRRTPERCRVTKVQSVLTRGLSQSSRELVERHIDKITTVESQSLGFLEYAETVIAKRRKLPIERLRLRLLDEAYACSIARETGYISTQNHGSQTHDKGLDLPFI